MRVRGEGPKPAYYMFIGEAPGEMEDKTGRPFVGKAGLELDRYMKSVQLDRSNVYITNLVKERPPNNRDPLPAEIERDREELEREIGEVNPQVIVTLGLHSTRFFLPEASMETHHAIPHRVGDRVIFPIYHPAAGLHSPETQTLIVYGFHRLRAFYNGYLTVEERTDRFPEPTYKLHLPSDPPVALPSLLVAMDTEGLQGRAWGLSLSTSPGSAWVVKADDTEELKRLNTALASKHVILHNSLHDLSILRELGVNVPKFHDTMVMAYLLCNEPQGLKPLAFRHAGMDMDSYLEIIREADRRLALNYLIDVYLLKECSQCHGIGKLPKFNKKGELLKGEKLCDWCEGDGTTWPKPEPTAYWEAGELRIYKPQSLGKRLRSIIADAKENEQLDVRARWMAIDEEVRALIEKTVGPMPEVSLDDVHPDEKAIQYSARDADATLRVFKSLWPLVQDMELVDVYETIIGIIPMVDRMQSVGMRIDPEYFKRFSAELKDVKAEAVGRLAKLAGYEINPASGPQVAKLLFEDWGLKGVKLTKSRTREAVDNKVLEALKLRYADREKVNDAIDAILDYREADKIDGTYAEALPRWADKANRVHSRIRVTRTASGRLASSDPNLMNQPTRSDLGKKIRAGFVAPPGFLLGSWDFDQIEMRVLAHESRDPNLLKVFNEGLDIHAMTASLVFRTPIEQVTKEQRTSAKSIGFGVVYGITASGLKAQMELRGLKWTEKECQGLIDAYLNDAYPGVGDYMRAKQYEARRYGYVRDMFGMIRYLPGVFSTEPRIAEEAIRQAGNHPIQAAAQGIIQRAMIKVWREILPMLWAEGYSIECIMQIHDELIFEFQEGIEELVDTLIVGGFATAVPLLVPVGCKGNWGKTWAELK